MRVDKYLWSLCVVGCVMFENCKGGRFEVFDIPHEECNQSGQNQSEIEGVLCDPSVPTLATIYIYIYIYYIYVCVCVGGALVASHAQSLRCNCL